jgi:hypothetical protein
MRPTESWAFSAPLSQVDVPRIIRESRLATTPGRVVRFTIDGKTYTAWRERDFPGRVGAVHPDGELSWDVDRTSLPFRIDGEVRIWTYRGEDAIGRGIRVEAGDHLTALVDRVATTVEVF